MSGVEIELKVRLADPEKVRLQLEALGPCVKESVKSDRYYRHDLDAKRIARIRTVSKRPGGMLTVKSRVLEDGVEVNQESEVAVESADEMEKVLQAMCYEAFLVKTKKTRLYKSDEVAMEFNEIVGLGHFLELELLLEPNPKAEAVTAAKARLHACLEGLGIASSAIEERPYMVLLRELGRSAQ